MDVDVRDLYRIEDDLRRAEEGMHDRASRLIRASTLQGEGLSKTFAPVRTGFLRASITSDTDTVGRVMHGEWGATARYGGYVDGGTSRMAPRPFISPALAIVEPQFHAGAELIADPFGVPR